MVATGREDACVTATYRVRTADCPQVLLRLLGLFAQQDLVPLHVSARRSGVGLDVRICQASLVEHRANVIAEKMRSIVTVHLVQLDYQSSPQP